MKQISTPEEIRETTSAFQQSRILLTAVELGLFTAIDKHMLNAEEVSQILKTDKRATDRLMNALFNFGLLRKVKGKFYNADLASKYLVEGKPDFMGNLYHSNHLWNTWTFLTESVKKGSSYKGEQNKKENDNWVEAFIAAMHYRGMKQAELVTMMIDTSNIKRMLDIGGGSGAFSMGFIKKNSLIISTVLDLPHVIPLTKKYVDKEGYKDNFDYIEGNYLKIDFGSGYDLILLSAIVHINSFEQNKRLIKKCCDALTKKGMIIINDFVMNDERTEPGYGTIFSLNMLVGTEYGDTYTENEMREWFNSAGIDKIEKKKTSFGSDLMIGYKI